MQASRTLFVLVLAALIGGFAGVAEACPGCNWSGDGKTIPGAMCDLRLDSESTSYGVDWRGGMCNLSFTEELRVSCPVVRDSVNNTNGMNCAEPFFYRDANTGATATCVLYARQTHGIGLYYSTSDSVNIMNTSSIPVKINGSYYRGYYHMTCLIPPKAAGSNYSCLRSFTWAEKT